MSWDYSYGVGYGFVVRPEDTEILEALTQDFSEDDLPVLSFGLDHAKFSKAYPGLNCGTSGWDGEDCNLVIMLKGTYRDIESKHSGKTGAFELREKNTSTEELAELISFANKYGIKGTPSWIVFTSVS